MNDDSTRLSDAEFSKRLSMASKKLSAAGADEEACDVDEAIARLRARGTCGECKHHCQLTFKCSKGILIRGLNPQPEWVGCHLFERREGHDD